MPEGSVCFELLATPGQVATATAAHIRAAATRAITERGRFHLVLAGGRTPIAAYRLLVDVPAQWEHWHIWFGDERCLPPADPQRNSVAVAQSLLEHVPIPRENLHLIQAERGPVAAALAYQATLGQVTPEQTHGAPPHRFDLVLLGMGEDGHTASLFPGQALADGPLVIPVFDSPKPPPQRVSLTPRALSDTHAMLVLVTGADKAAALAAWRAGADLPVARVAALGAARVLLDHAAAGGACLR